MSYRAPPAADDIRHLIGILKPPARVVCVCSVSPLGHQLVHTDVGVGPIPGSELRDVARIRVAEAGRAAADLDSALDPCSEPQRCGRNGRPRMSAG
jgi:hypothetical protein